MKNVINFEKLNYIGCLCIATYLRHEHNIIKFKTQEKYKATVLNY